MAKTAVADIIIPTEFERYAIERTAELSTFGQCGIVEHAPKHKVTDNLSVADNTKWQITQSDRQLIVTDNLSVADNTK